MSSKSMGLVAIILVNYNGTTDTIECINSLNDIMYTNYKVVIVDNASRADQVEKLEEICNEKIILIKSQENLGFAGGNNLGIKYAIDHGADFICLLNNDTIVEKDFLNHLVERYNLNDSIGIVCPMILDYYNQSRITYGGGDINYLKGGCYILGINSYDEAIMNLNREITFAHGCCMLISKNAIEKIGFLPEKYFLYYEDTEYSIKAVKKGFKIWYEPMAKIWHKESVSTCKGSSNFQYYFTRNRLFFIRNNFSIKNKFTAYPITILYVIKKIIQRKFDVLPPLVGIKDFLRGKTGKR